MTENNENNIELEVFLRERIAESGPIPFVDFMEQCLYHPRWGYYAAPRQRIGKEGDFFTSSSVHSLFGRLVFRQLRQMAEILEAETFTVVEQGAGEGHLSLDILNAARNEDPDFYDRLEYVLVEIGEDGRRRQKELLAEHASRVKWADFDQLEPVVGCFLSNELVDAFPVHLVEQTPEGLREIYVDWQDGAFKEKMGALSTSRIEEYFSRLGITLREGNRAEVNLAAEDWMTEVAQKLKRGFVVTIDYGYQAQELFSPLRRTGTLLCYQHHQTNENPLENVGRQDITSHVDFTTLPLVGEEFGLKPLYFGPQYRFLMGLGFVEELMRLQADLKDPKEERALRMTLKNLIMPDQGMGETFKVLVQGKQVGTPKLLCQRAIGDIPVPL